MRLKVDSFRFGNPLKWSTLLLFPGFVGVAFSTGGFSILGRSVARSGPDGLVRGSPPLAIRPDLVDLGALRPGQSAVSMLTVQNTLSHAVTLQRIESSCPCIATEGIRAYLRPNETGLVGVSFNPFEDPEFRGSLCVRLTGYLDDGRMAFQTKVNLKVKEGGGESP